jgi:hypothetical protein
MPFVRKAYFYSCRLLSNLLCHWLVDRADGRGFLKVVLLDRGRFLCSWKLTEKEGVREWFAVVVKLLLTRLLC